MSTISAPTPIRRPDRAGPGPVLIPRLTRPVTFLRRGDDAVQVGLDHPDAFRLANAAPALAEVLRLIDGRRALPDLRLAARRHGVPREQLDEAIAVLRQAGLVEIRRAPDRTPADADGSLLGARLCMLGTGSVRAALAEALERCGAVVRRSERTLPEPEDPPLRLTVLAADTAEPDRALAAALVRADLPHLVVRTAGDLAVVGPLVLPGRTACLRCVDLTRTEGDPAWPDLLTQLTRLRQPASRLLADWIVGTALTQVAAAVRGLGGGLGDPAGSGPETRGATLELSGSDLTPRLRRWPSHPECGCGWGRSAE